MHSTVTYRNNNVGYTLTVQMLLILHVHVPLMEAKTPRTQQK